MKKQLILCAAIAASGLAFSDTVSFKSGDRLTGTIGKIEKGKMEFKSKLVGSQTFKLADISAFSMDKPVTYQMTNEEKHVLHEGTFTLANTNGQLTVVSAASTQKVDIARFKIINKPKPAWKGAIVASYLETQGNSETRTVTITANANRRTEDFYTLLGAGYYFAQERDSSTGDKSTTDDNWFIEGKEDWFFTEKTYVYGNARWFKDRMLYLERRVTAGTGLGYQWMETSEWNIFTEAGGTVVSEKYTDPDEHNDYLAARAAYHIEYNLSKTFSAFHNAEILPSLKDNEFLANADAGVNAKITSDWFAQAKVSMIYDSDVPDNRENMDTRYTVGIGWNF